MATAMARNGSRGSPISPPKGLNTIRASSAASSVRYSANRYSSRRSASSAVSGRAAVRVKDDPGGGVGSRIGGGRRAAPISRLGAAYRSQPLYRSREKVPEEPDRERVVQGMSVSVQGKLGGRSIVKKKKK